MMVSSSELGEVAREAPVIFLHIPKTAGMSLHGLFVRHYRGRLIHNMGVKNITAEEWQRGLERVRAMPAAQRDAVAVFKGHMIFGLHDLLERPARYVTFLRDPVKRLLSHYRMVYRLGGLPAETVLDPARPMWGLTADPALYRSIDNYQVRALSGADFDLPFGACAEEHLARAKDNLERHFVFVGLTDRFDLSLVLLRHVLGWKTRFYMPDNIGAETRAPVAPGTVDKLREINRLDTVLVAFARERFERLVAAHGWPLQAEHVVFRAGNWAHARLHRGRHGLKRFLGIERRPVMGTG
jgi:hypothetical protein